MLSRLSYAKELLLTTDLGVAEISARSGFGDVNNFIRSFKRLNGVTPNRYRRRNA
jgi:AraC-like DNA-binding protein